MGIRPRSMLRGCLSRIVNFIFCVIKMVTGIERACSFLERIDKRQIQYTMKSHGARIGRANDIERGITFHNCRGFEYLIIGDECHIGKQCFFDLKSGITMGDRVTISMRTMILTHIDVGRSSTAGTYNTSTGSVSIGDDVYIGAGAIILPGVKIGPGSVIAAGSVVTKDIRDNALYAGVPAIWKKNLRLDRPEH